MAVFCEIMSRDHLTNLMMQVAVSSETFVHVYQCTRVPVYTTLPTKIHNSTLKEMREE